jgi:hypothetical protein
VVVGGAVVGGAVVGGAVVGGAVVGGAVVGGTVTGATVVVVTRVSTGTVVFAGGVVVGVMGRVVKPLVCPRALQEFPGQVVLIPATSTVGASTGPYFGVARSRTTTDTDETKTVKATPAKTRSRMRRILPPPSDACAGSLVRDFGP